EWIWGISKLSSNETSNVSPLKCFGDQTGNMMKQNVREFWAYTLLSTTTKEELDKWMSLVEYRTIDIWICINLFLRKFYPDAPEMEFSPDPDPKIMTSIVAPVLDWYKQSINSSA
ncbi:hypothetical protein, partial [Laceyella tengchongensis]|uniref:hypothetical protein n=1 Tax=Laceyella tengchongensis TaxID=574699 RepID=UPI001E45CF55